MRKLLQSRTNSRDGVIEDREVYEDLVCSHVRDVYRFAYRLCGTPDRAEDLVQETMYHAWRSIGSLRDRSRVRGWLYQILHNRFKHMLRAQGRRIKVVNDSEQLNRFVDRGTADTVANLSDRELLQISLDELDERFKTPFLLVFMEELTCREAAEILKLPLGTVLSRIHRARQLLRSTLVRLEPSWIQQFQSNSEPDKKRQSISNRTPTEQRE